MLQSERKKRWFLHITQLKKIHHSGQIELIFQGSYTQIFDWVNSPKRRLKKNGRLWIEAADEPARVLKRAGPKNHELRPN